MTSRIWKGCPISLSAIMVLLTGCGADGRDGIDGKNGADGKDGKEGLSAATCVVQPQSAKGKPPSAKLIQDCIDALPATGGLVVVRTYAFAPYNLYVVDQPVHILKSNVELRGERGVTLKVADKKNVTGIIVGALDDVPTVKLSNIKITSLIIDGNRKNQSSEYHAKPMQYLRVNGITIRGPVTDSVVHDVSITGARSGALVTEYGVMGLWLNRIVARDSHFDGLALYRTTYSLVTHCLLENNLAAGISTDWGFNHNTLSDNIIRNNGKGISGTSNNPGIYIADSSFNLWDSNTVKGSSGNGILITDQASVPGSGSSNNYFSNTMLLNNKEFGIWLTAKAGKGNTSLGTFYCKNGSGKLLNSGAAANFSDNQFMECK